MGLFSTSSPLDQYVERATSEKNTSEDWGQIMDICDRVRDSTTGPKDCMKSLIKRLNSENPRVVLQAITLLDACISNCGRKFHLEVASRDFELELKKLITSSRTHQKVSEKLQECVKKWAEGEFKGDAQLSLIPSLYNKLRQEGYEFNASSDSPKRTVKFSTDPNVVDSKQEEDDIAKAIQLSLQESETKSSAVRGGTSSLYPSAFDTFAGSGLLGSNSQDQSERELKKARALYDFEAAEDNELTFKAGEILTILDDGDPNWWKGSSQRGEGLFPANFVTLDLSEGETLKSGGGKKVSFSECVNVAELDGESEADSDVHYETPTGEIDESRIDELLMLLHEADPTGERPDDPRLASLEEQVNAMAPSIDAELEQIDRTHAELARISNDLMDALNLYHQLSCDVNPHSAAYYGSVPTGKGMASMPHGTTPLVYPPPHQVTTTQAFPNVVGPYSAYMTTGPQHIPSMPGYSAPGQASAPSEMPQVTSTSDLPLKQPAGVPAMPPPQVAPPQPPHVGLPPPPPPQTSQEHGHTHVSAAYSHFPPHTSLAPNFVPHGPLPHGPLITMPGHSGPVFQPSPPMQQ